MFWLFKLVEGSGAVASTVLDVIGVLKAFLYRLV